MRARAALALLPLALMGLLWPARHSDTLTASQAALLAEPLLRALAPTGSLTLAEPQPIYEEWHPGGRRLCWLVSASGDAGFTVAWATVSMEAGEVVSAGTPVRWSAGRGSLPPVDANAVADASRHWLSATGIAPQSAHWALVGRPCRSGPLTWRTCWRGTDRYAFLRIDMQAGKLVSAVVSPADYTPRGWLHGTGTKGPQRGERSASRAD